RHISGSRATEIDVVPLGAHRELILGRAPSAAVRFDPRGDPWVGRHHARIEPGAADASTFQVHDLGSRNGTFLNGQRITGPSTLRPGDILRLGEHGPELEVLVELSATPTR
ncbi:MAG: FHA domain-containing protein, partial [Gemmatimonadota bacterium]